MTIGSTPIRSARPPATPVSTRSVRLRENSARLARICCGEGFAGEGDSSLAFVGSVVVRMLAASSLATNRCSHSSGGPAIGDDPGCDPFHQGFFRGNPDVGGAWGAA